jgi:hypothetical protein
MSLELAYVPRFDQVARVRDRYKNVSCFIAIATFLKAALFCRLGQSRFDFFASSVLRFGIWNWPPVIVTAIGSVVLLAQGSQRVKITETANALRLGPAAVEDHP